MLKPSAIKVAQSAAVAQMVAAYRATGAQFQTIPAGVSKGLQMRKYMKQDFFKKVPEVA